jgi:mono/diheme cytochrome c family protein
MRYSLKAFTFLLTLTGLFFFNYVSVSLAQDVKDNEWGVEHVEGIGVIASVNGIVVHGDRYRISHPGIVVEDGLQFEPICPQARNTNNAPDKFLKLVNPLKPSIKNIFAGQTLFHFDGIPSPCRLCHGISGNGLSVLMRQLNPSPRNFACNQIMDSLPDGQLFWIIKYGSQGTAMPAYNKLQDDQIWQVIHYIRHFSNKIKE